MTGDCRTVLQISRLPLYQMMRQDQEIVVDECRYTNVYEILKIKDFDHCRGGGDGGEDQQQQPNFQVIQLAFNHLLPVSKIIKVFLALEIGSLQIPNLRRIGGAGQYHPNRSVRPTLFVEHQSGAGR